jgi:hypothetical protein
MKEGNKSLCIHAKNYDFRSIKLLFCTRDVQVKANSNDADASSPDIKLRAVDPVKLKVSDPANPSKSSYVSFYEAVDSFARVWHFTDEKTAESQSKTLHMSPFVSVCFQPCTTECFTVTSTLVFNRWFIFIFAACLGIALVLCILAHRCWRLLSTSVVTVALPCIVIFLIAKNRAGSTLAGITAFGGWGLMYQYGKPYVVEFVKSPHGQAVLVVYIALIVAANYFLPVPRYDQKSAVAWLGRIVCAAVVLVVSPLGQIPVHHLQDGVPSSHLVTPNVSMELIVIVTISFEST